MRDYSTRPLPRYLSSTQAKSLASDFYGDLGLPFGTPFAGVKRRYKELSKKLHPDVQKRLSAEERSDLEYPIIVDAYKKLGELFDRNLISVKPRSPSPVYRRIPVYSPKRRSPRPVKKTYRSRPTIHKKTDFTEWNVPFHVNRTRTYYRSPARTYFRSPARTYFRPRSPKTNKFSYRKSPGPKKNPSPYRQRRSPKNLDSTKQQQQKFWKDYDDIFNPPKRY